MLAELGHFSLIAALWCSVLSLLCGFGGAAWRRRLGVLCALSFLLIGVSFVVLALLFLRSDFSVLVVAGNSHSMLPWFYRLCAVWGNHEGSLVLWCLLLAGWTLAFSRSGGGGVGVAADLLRARSVAVLAALNGAFLAICLFTSNPFARLLPLPPAEGQDLNPLLQDPAMVFHPPMLYAGLTGLAVPFACAVAVLLGGIPGHAWARLLRPWVRAAWTMLGAGIVLGSWWAYYELGWGGWWFWDPVENASLLPWLVATALLHLLVVCARDGSLRLWVLALALGGFSLCLLGVFLVRSGVLISVHAFASDPSRGVVLLLLLAAAAGGGFALYGWRTCRGFADQEERRRQPGLESAVEDTAPTAPAAPAGDTAPTALTAPAGDTAPTALTAPAGDTVPTALTASAGDTAPTALTASAGNTAPTALTAPAGDTAPTALTASAGDMVPTALTTPAGDTAPTAPAGDTAPTAPTALAGDTAPTAPAALATNTASATHATVQSQHQHPALIGLRGRFLLLNSILLVLMGVVILWGTLFPLVMNALGQGRYSVGAPWFQQVLAAPAVLLLVLMGMGQGARWRGQSWAELLRRQYPAMGGALLLGGAALLLPGGGLSPLLLLGVALAVWPLLSMPRRRGFPWAMRLAHSGAALLALGIVAGAIFSTQHELVMRPGEKHLLAGYHFQFQGVRELTGPNYQARQGLFEVRRKGRLVTHLYPQKRRYVGNSNEMTEAAIDGNLWRDLYVVLGAPVAEQGAWTIRLRYLPGIRLLLLGGALILCGGVAGFVRRRMR